jgi:hypothetical protein
METLLIFLLLPVLLGAGGSYYGYSRRGDGDGIGILTLSIIHPVADALGGWAP